MDCVPEITDENHMQRLACVVEGIQSIILPFVKVSFCKFMPSAFVYLIFLPL